MPASNEFLLRRRGLGHTIVVMARREVYFSIDVEADGPIPGPYSMLSFGACVFGWKEKGSPRDRFVPVDVESRTFYVELKPISDSFDPQALKVSGLDRGSLCVEGTDPLAAMNGFRSF